MNRINPNKLLLSKWTATKPARNEKHFIVSEVETNEEDVVIFCVLEAVTSKRSIQIDWHELEDAGKWLHGWK